VNVFALSSPFSRDNGAFRYCFALSCSDALSRVP
jgi:hypothetical protein